MHSGSSSEMHDVVVWPFTWKWSTKNWTYLRNDARLILSRFTRKVCRLHARLYPNYCSSLMSFPWENVLSIKMYICVIDSQVYISVVLMTIPHGLAIAAIPAVRLYYLVTLLSFRHPLPSSTLKWAEQNVDPWTERPPRDRVFGQTFITVNPVEGILTILLGAAHMVLVIFSLPSKVAYLSLHLGTSHTWWIHC